MKEEILTDAVLREFLLGNVNDEEQAQIEGLFLTDSEARERVLVIEQELMEDYLEDSLTAEDRERFLSRYGQTDAQLQQLRITKAIKDWALRENASQTTPASPSLWRRLRASLLLKPAFFAPIAAAAIIAVVVGGIWFNGRMKRAALLRELAQLNSSASLRDVPAQMALLELRPITVRSLEQATEFKKSADVHIVELRLPWIQKESYPSYQAEVRPLSGGDSLIVPNLQAENDGLLIIRMRLFTNELNRGQYQIRLSGIDSGGVVGTTEEYAFIVES
ncbi:MAG TPA: hypothetical protein VFI24_23490 [Pyrinomonadaceae bacterium]|nr:hypothetical protein [Pyrinomonadaceae bacterium]